MDTEMYVLYKMKIPGKPIWPQLRDPKEFGLKAIKTSIRKPETFSDSSGMDEEGKITSEMQSSLPIKRNPPGLRLLGIPSPSTKIPPELRTAASQTRRSRAELDSSLERKCSRLELITPAQL